MCTAAGVHELGRLPGLSQPISARWRCSPSPHTCAGGPPTGYLGDADKEAWKEYDATELMRQYKGPHLPMLVDTVGAAVSAGVLRGGCRVGGVHPHHPWWRLWHGEALLGAR